MEALLSHSSIHHLWRLPLSAQSFLPWLIPFSCNCSSIFPDPPNQPPPFCPPHAFSCTYLQSLTVTDSFNSISLIHPINPVARKNTRSVVLSVYMAENSHVKIPSNEQADVLVDLLPYPQPTKPTFLTFQPPTTTPTSKSSITIDLMVRSDHQ